MRDYFANDFDELLENYSDPPLNESVELMIRDYIAQHSPAACLPCQSE